MDLTLDLGPLRFPVAFLIALLLSVYFTPVIRRGAIRYGVMDVPSGPLKQHKQATPYLGGIAIFLAFLFALAFTCDFTEPILGILLSASIIVMIGLFDDLKVLTPSVKLLGQMVAAFVCVKSGIMVKLTFLGDWASLLLTMFWLVGMTNAINLIDVSDGLAAGVASIAGMFLYIVALWNGETTFAMVTLALVGATLGFLAYNRPPASIFLGDTGSMFLGFMLGAIAMNNHYTVRQPLAAAAPAIILGVPIFDTMFVIGARLVRRIPIMHGSPDHFAVRLRDHGVSAQRIVGCAYLTSTALGCVALALCWVQVEVAAGILGALGLSAGSAVFALWRLGRGPDSPRG